MEIPHLDLFVLFGKTGSGKTAVLQALKRAGQQVIDLEEIARHRGSVFGEITGGIPAGKKDAARSLQVHLNAVHPGRPVFMEWKGNHLGNFTVPPSLLIRMKAAPAILLKLSRKQRIHRLLSEYKGIPPKKIYEALFLLRPRLGEETFESCLKALDSADLRSFVDGMLAYYDGGILYTPPPGPVFLTLDCGQKSAEDIAGQIILFSQSLE